MARSLAVLAFGVWVASSADAQEARTHHLEEFDLEIGEEETILSPRRSEELGLKNFPDGFVWILRKNGLDHVLGAVEPDLPCEFEGRKVERWAPSRNPRF